SALRITGLIGKLRHSFPPILSRPGYTVNHRHLERHRQSGSGARCAVIPSENVSPLGVEGSHRVSLKVSLRDASTSARDDDAPRRKVLFMELRSATLVNL